MLGNVEWSTVRRMSPSCNGVMSPPLLARNDCRIPVNETDAFAVKPYQRDFPNENQTQTKKTEFTHSVQVYKRRCVRSHVLPARETASHDAGVHGSLHAGEAALQLSILLSAFAQRVPHNQLPFLHAITPIICFISPGSQL
jgi:hypothetical protein